MLRARAMRTRLRRTSAKLQICLAGRVLRAADNLRYRAFESGRSNMLKIVEISP
jgi:hypothetical protein